MNGDAKLIKRFYQELNNELQSFTLSLDELLRTLDFVKVSYVGKYIAGIAGLRKGNFLFVIVKERFQNRGIGKRLLQEVIQEAKKKRYHYVQLTVYKENQHAAHLYKKVGFKSLPLPVKVDGKASYYMIKPLSWQGWLFAFWSRFRALLRWIKDWLRAWSKLVRGENT